MQTTYVYGELGREREARVFRSLSMKRVMGNTGMRDTQLKRDIGGTHVPNTRIQYTPVFKHPLQRLTLVFIVLAPEMRSTTTSQLLATVSCPLSLYQGILVLSY